MREILVWIASTGENFDLIPFYEDKLYSLVQRDSVLDQGSRWTVELYCMDRNSIREYM